MSHRWHQRRWYMRARGVQRTLPLALTALLILSIVLQDQPREVIHIIVAATMPALVPTLVVSGIVHTIVQVERTFPQPIQVWDAVTVVIAALIGAGYSSWLMQAVRYSEEYQFGTMMVRALMFTGVLLIVGAVVSPRFAWVAVVVVLAATLRPFLQNPHLVAERPAGVLWWPVLPASTRLAVIAFAVLILGTWLYVDGAWRIRRWFWTSRRVNRPEIQSRRDNVQCL